MKRFFIVTNLIKDPRQETTEYIADYLRSHGAEADILIRDVISKQELYETGDYNPLLVPPLTECIIVLGGDGTLLKAARDTLRLGIPLVGVNLGTLGFLAQVEKDGIRQALDHLLADEYEVESRMLLSGSFWHGQEQKSAHALNDIVVSRKGPLMVIPYEISVNGQDLAAYNADGIILSTPTGSTGYNLSAGGPIVNPGAQLMVITPICPHTMNTRSIVLSRDDEVQIRIGNQRNAAEADAEAEIYFDGELFGSMKHNDRITIRASELTVKLVRLSSVSFLKSLHNKMDG